MKVYVVTVCDVGEAWVSGVYNDEEDALKHVDKSNRKVKNVPDLFYEVEEWEVL